MRTISRLALASGGALLLSFAIVPLAQAAQTADDPAGNPRAMTSESGKPPTTTPGSNSQSGSTDATTATDTSSNDGSIGGSRANAQLEKLRADATKRTAEARQRVDKIRSDAQVKGGAKLETAKLRVCQNHEKTIESLMSRIGKRGKGHVDLIDTIAARVEKYVTDNNLTVANYDALVAAVAAAKTTAQTASDNTQAAQPTFSCAGNDPNGSADVFKDLTKTRDGAVKTYRDAVKALLTAVKAAAPVTPTPAPNTTPTTSTGDNQ